MIWVPIARIIVGGIVLGVVVGACDGTPRQVAPTAEPVGLVSPANPATPAPLAKASIAPEYVVLKPGESHQFTFEACRCQWRSRHQPGTGMDDLSRRRSHKPLWVVYGWQAGWCLF